MPISDYANAFFFARRKKVTLSELGTPSRDHDCRWRGQTKPCAARYRWPSFGSFGAVGPTTFSVPREYHATTPAPAPMRQDVSEKVRPKNQTRIPLTEAMDHGPRSRCNFVSRHLLATGSWAHHAIRQKLHGGRNQSGGDPLVSSLSRWSNQNSD
jgi:hypothetical protein